MPENPSDLHVVGRTADGQLWHTIRSPGGWTGLGDVLEAANLLCAEGPRRRRRVHAPDGRTWGRGWPVRAGRVRQRAAKAALPHLERRTECRHVEPEARRGLPDCAQGRCRDVYQHRRQSCREAHRRDPPGRGDRRRAPAERVRRCHRDRAGAAARRRGGHGRRDGRAASGGARHGLHPRESLLLSAAARGHGQCETPADRGPRGWDRRPNGQWTGSRLLRALEAWSCLPTPSTPDSPAGVLSLRPGTGTCGWRPRWPASG
jgi:hypothetical protein